MKAFKVIRIMIAFAIGCALLCGCAILVANRYVKTSTADRIITPETAAQFTDMDCILVLGCQVKADGVPSHMLEDRLRRGVELYHSAAAPKMLMSGDHGQENYNEVGTMKRYAIDAAVPSTDVFMDHAGFSTYESVYRAKEIFGVQRMIIVTQEYHLPRALYIAEQMGVEAYGVPADYRTYFGQIKRDIREVLARCKDMFTTAWEVPPTYSGESISIHGDGDQTND